MGRAEGKPIGMRGRDRKVRRKSGYALRWMKERQKNDYEKTGI